MEGIKATLREITQVPHSWDAWAVRVLTIAIVLVFTAIFILGGMLKATQDTIDSGRAERRDFQLEERARQCELLRQHGVTSGRLKELKC